MKLFRNFSLLSLAAVAGCSPSTPASSEAELQAELNKLATHCNVPTSTVRAHDGSVAVGGEELADVPYERMRCLMDGLKARGLIDKIGFVGNEAYE